LNLLYCKGTTVREPLKLVGTALHVSIVCISLLLLNVLRYMPLITASEVAYR
jgi:hypothetical protein